MNVKLLIVQGRPEGKCLLFPRGEYVFGRGDECHVRPNSDWVSRQHCLLRVTAGEAYLRDLGSRNGTLVNGVRLVQECLLQHGDQVQVGPLVFEVLLDEAVPAGAVPVPGAESPAHTSVPSAAETLARALDTAELPALRTDPAGKPGEAPSAPHTALPVREAGR
jgi:predicted component of type VI protein secretion system